jgi:hypothetical protein
MAQDHIGVEDVFVGTANTRMSDLDDSIIVTQFSMSRRFDDAFGRSFVNSEIDSHFLLLIAGDLVVAQSEIDPLMVLRRCLFKVGCRNY